MNDRIVIVGGGQAGAQAIASLRARGFTGAIALIAKEPHLPYQRPPLSKKYLAGEIVFDRMLIKAESFYGRHDVRLFLGTSAVSISRERQVVTLSNGEDIEYSGLVLATGASIRQLAIAGADLAGIHYVRTVADTDGLRESFRSGARLVIVGGGYIGLEVAAIAVKLGLEVTVVEAADRVMHRVVDATISDFYERAHTEAGVRILTSKFVARLEGDSQVSAVICEDGTRLPADIVVIGVGVAPNTELAAQAGLAVDDGIVVDEFTRTSDPNICAVGDCTNFPSALYQRRLRLECVQNANDQSRAAALTLTGQPASYDPVPWFWSEQYDLKLQIAGLSSGYDTTVVRGNPTNSRSFAVFYLCEGTLIAVDAVNRPQDYIVGRKLVELKVQTAPELLRDETVDLKIFLS